MGFYFNTNSLTPSTGSGGGGGGGGGTTVWARNDLGASYTVTAGDKVWLSPISTEMEQEYKWTSTSQFGNYTTLYLMQYEGFDSIFKAGNYSQLYVFDSTEETMTTVTGTGLGTNAGFSNAVYVSPYITTFKASTSEYQTSSGHGTITRTQYLHHGWSIDYSSHNLYKYNTETAAIDTGTTYGTSVAVTDNTFIYVNKAGTACFSIYSTSYPSLYRRLIANAQGVFAAQTQQATPNTRSIVDYNVLGATSDEKYLIIYKPYAGPSSPASNAIFEFNADATDFVGEYTDLNLSGAISFYPHNQILTANDAGTIRMWKYDATNGFVEQNIDFGETTFSSSNPVTLNYDASKMCVNDGSNGVYLFTLNAASPNSYKAIPFKRINFNSNSFTGILTGEESGTTVEVKAVMS